MIEIADLLVESFVLIAPVSEGSHGIDVERVLTLTYRAISSLRARYFRLKYTQVESC